MQLILFGGSKNVYSACLRQVEKGEKSWSDSFLIYSIPFYLWYFTFSGINEVREFIRDHPQIHPYKDEKTKIYRIKSNMFNDRKVAREKLRRQTNQKKSVRTPMKQESI